MFENRGTARPSQAQLEQARRNLALVMIGSFVALLVGAGAARTRCAPPRSQNNDGVRAMGFGRGALLWLLGVPLPIVILLALFWR
jgi:hypothetical protein